MKGYINHPSRRQHIKTEADRQALIEAVKVDHPRNVAERLGMRPDSIRGYIRDAKTQMRTELLAQGYTTIEAEERIHRVFYRDGVTMKTITVGE